MLKPTPRIKTSGDQCASDPALRTLFEEEESALLRYAFSLVGRREVAEEIVQEIFLKLHAQFKQIDSPKAWLFRAVRNRSFTYLRDNKREVLRSEPDDTANPSHETPEVTMERMEMTAALRNMLTELDEIDQQLVKLKYFENLKYREISEQTGLTVSNVGYRLHHILKKLAAKLRPLGIDGNS